MRRCVIKECVGDTTGVVGACYERWEGGGSKRGGG